MMSAILSLQRASLAKIQDRLENPFDWVREADIRFSVDLFVGRM